MGRRPNLWSVLADGCTSFDTQGFERRICRTRVHRDIHCRRAWLRLKVVVADIDTVLAGISDRMSEGLVIIRPMGEPLHRCRVTERRRAQRFELARWYPENTTIQSPPSAGEGQGNIAGRGIARRTGDNGIEAPGV